MKIGTVTVQNGNNYGASLQAFALVSYLRKIGIEANLIDYRNLTIEKRLSEKTSTQLSGGLKKSIRNIVSKILFRTNYYSDLKREVFEQFHKSFLDNQTGPFYSCEQMKGLNNVYDGFICGSDQIWNKSITELDDTFFLKFALVERKRIAYAPSIGAASNSLSIEDQNELKEKLSSVEYLSIREENNKDMIEKLSGKTCDTVVDPVLLFSKNDWENVISGIDPVVSGKYAVFYPVVNQPELETFAKKRAKELGLLLVNPRLVPRYAKVKGFTGIPNRMVGPLEFVRLIHDAECVFTNSFHATVFSSLFNKNLYILELKNEQKNRNNRIVEYLKGLDLYDKNVDSLGLIHVEEFDESELIKHLSSKVHRSMEYLRIALE